MWTLRLRGCSPTNRSTSTSFTNTGSRQLRYVFYCGFYILTAAASLATVGCGFQLVSSSSIPDADGRSGSIYFTGSLNRETEIGLKHYFRERGFSIDRASASVVVNFDSISSSERAIRFDARGNAIEYVMRVEWSFGLKFKGDNEAKTQYTLHEVSLYRHDEDALLATANQKSLTRKELILQLSKDLSQLISLELSRSTSSGAAR